MEKKTSSKEQALFEKLEEVITHADISSNQAIKSSSFAIEKTIELLHGRKRKLEDTWEERKRLLEQSVQSSQLDEAIKKCSDWLRLDGEKYIKSSLSFGDSVAETQQFTQKHKEYIAAYKKRKETVHDLIREGQKLIHSGHFDSATIKYKIGKLEHSYLLFSQQLELRETLLDQTLTFLISSQQVILSVEAIQKKLQHKSSESEKAKYRLEATDVSSKVLREGQILLNKTNNNRIQSIVMTVKEKYDAIMSLTDDHTSSDDKEMVLVNKDMEHTSNWLINICEEFLNVHRQMGTTRNHTYDFLKDHQQLSEEMNGQIKQLSNIKSTLLRFPKKKRKQVMEASDKLDAMQLKSSTLTNRISFRIALVEMFAEFLKHSDEVLKKIFLLEEELTSDEPHENVNATSVTLNRQKQEKEEIINTAEILQEEGQRILEDLSLCSEESTLDRNGIKLKIGRDLKNIVQHTMQLEELWEQREAQLDTNKRLSTQFFEFEKEIRKVIGCIHDQSEKFFPLAGEFPGLTATHKDIQKKLSQVKDVSKLANIEIENHLGAAENLAKSTNRGVESAHVVTNELKLVHQKFKTKLTKYEALLSICSTFYTSVEKLVTFMNKSLHEYTADFLPRNTIYAQQKLKDHFESFCGVDDLFHYTIQNGSDVLQSIREYEELGIKSTTFDALFESSSNHSGGKDTDWKEIYESNQIKLEEGLKILQVLQDISQISLVIEDYTRKLLNINRQFGDSLLSTVTLCQEADQFQDQIKAAESQLAQVRTNISKFVQVGHPDAGQLSSKLNLLEKRWFKLVNLMEDHKTLLNNAVEFYQLCDQVETWINDSIQFLKTTRGGARRCVCDKDILELVQLIENFKYSGVEIQESRLSRLSDVSSALGGDDVKQRALHLKDSQERINAHLENLKADMENQRSKISHADQGQKFDSYQWNDDEDFQDIVIPSKRIKILTTFPSSLLAMPKITTDLSLKGDEVLQWSDGLEHDINAPKLLVSVSSNTKVPPDMQQRISPIVQKEMSNIKKRNQISDESTSIEIQKNNDGALLGPTYIHEVSVKTDYDIETSPPSPSTDDKGYIYTMKKTLTTTTKEVTTRTKQEIKTELEVIHVDSEDDLPKRLALATKECDRVGVSILTKSGIDRSNENLNDNGVVRNIEGELKNVNENICKGVETSLFTERSALINDSLIAPTKGDIPPNKSHETGILYEISAKDANNKGVTVRHIPKANIVSMNRNISGNSNELRPISMVELTLNLEDLDIVDDHDNNDEQHHQNKVQESFEEVTVADEAITPATVQHEETLSDSNDVISIETNKNETCDISVAGDNKIKESEKVRKISESEYTNNLVEEILKASVAIFDDSFCINQLKEEEEKYLNFLNCTIQNFMDKIAVAPLKLQKNKEPIFRNIKDLLHFHQSVMLPKLSECKTVEDISSCYLENCTKMSKLYNNYISKGVGVENILTNTSYFHDCPNHKSHLKEHLHSPQDHLATTCSLLLEIIKGRDTQQKDTTKLKFILQLLSDVQGLIKRDTSEIKNTLERIKKLSSNEKNSPLKNGAKIVVDEDTLLVTNYSDLHTAPNNTSDELLKDVLKEYDIINSNRSDINGNFDESAILNQARYIVSKGYTVKHVDELQLPLGTEVCWMRSDEVRTYVVALNNSGEELDRGWLPSFCLQRKEDVIDKNSREAKHPEFVLPLTSCSAIEGNEAKLCVEVAGYPKPEVVWYLDGLPVRNDIHHRIVEENNSITLHIVPAVIDDEGVYTVKASNTLGSTSCQAEFIVESDVSSMSGVSDLEWEESIEISNNKRNGHHRFAVGEEVSLNASIGLDSSKAYIPPKFTQILKDRELALGTKATFQVKVQGEPSPDVSWYLNEMKLENNKRLFSHRDKVIHTLNILNVSERDHGTLKCEIKNEAGTKTCCCKLTLPSTNANNNPSVFSLFGTVKAIENKDAVIVVKYAGNPSPEINWYRDEIHLTKEYGVDVKNSDGESKLILPDVTKDDSGLYTCFVKNQYGERNCCVELVVVNEKENDVSLHSETKPLINDGIDKEGPPEIVEQVSDKQIYEGDTAKFKIRLRNTDSNVKVTWHHNGKQLSLDDFHYKFVNNSDTYQLVIDVCEQNDSGEYNCLVENSHGKAKSSSTIVVSESIYSPKFIDHTKDLYCEIGKTYTLTATIKSKPVSQVEWYKDNKIIDEKSEGYKMLKEGNSYSLIISDFLQEFSGSYKCSAFNNAGESACIINVSVLNGEQNPAKLFEQFCDIKADVGDSVKLESTVSSSDPVKVSWFKDGVLLDDGHKYHYDIGSETHSLLILSLTENDSGLYKCEATNAAGESSCECKLDVSLPQGSPKIIKPLRDLLIPEHEKNVEMKISVIGDPSPDVLFYKDGAIIESSARRRVVREGNDHMLCWKYVLPDDTGNYNVVVTNDHGEVTTNATMTVLSNTSLPEFTDCKTNYTVTEGDELIMLAVAKGVPAPKIQWMRDNLLLESNNDQRILADTPGESLFTKIARGNDSGSYLCAASNCIGKVQMEIQVAVDEGIKAFAPEFSTTISDIDVYSGTQVCLELGIIGNPEPSIEWKKDGVILENSTTCLIAKENGITTLKLPKCLTNDAGLYECIASSSVGQVSRSCVLSVSKALIEKTASTSTAEKSKAPKFLSLLHDMRMTTSEALILETIVTGEPFPDVRWYRQDKLLHPGKRIKISTNGRDGKSSLRIVNVKKHDSGEYECVAKNEHGETSMSCEIFVQDTSTVSKQDSIKLVGKPLKPSITNKPEEPTVNEGEKIEFSFTVNGNPLPSIEIMKNGNKWKPPVPRIATSLENNIFKFEATESNLKDEAMYEFIAKNSYGKDSFKMEICVDECSELEVVAKTIGDRGSSKEEVQIVNQEVLSSSSTEDDTIRKKSTSRRPSKRLKKRENKTSCNKDGDETDTEDWVDVTERSKEIVNEDVIIADAEKNVENTPSIDLDIKVPTFIKECNDLLAIEGTDTTFFAKFEGCPRPIIRWLKDGKPINKSDCVNIEETNDSVTLTLKKIQQTDNGEFTCVLENQHGTKSCTARLNVTPILTKPEWISKLTDVTVTEGEQALMEVVVQGTPTPEVQFFHDDTLVSASERISIISDDATGRHALCISNSILKDTKTFKCAAKNSEGLITCLGKLKVCETLIAPHFVNELQDSEVTEKREIKFKLEATGKPKPLIEWYFNDQLLKPSSRIKMRSDRNVNTLQILSCKYEDEGIYKAIASNLAGEVTTCCTIKIVEDTKQPDFIYIPKPMRTVEGRACSFRVSFNGKPDPEAEWLHGGTPVDPSVFEIKNESGKSTLTIKNVEINHTGVYTCTVTNKAGSASCNLELNVDEAQTRPIFIEKLKEILSCDENETVQLSACLKGKPKPIVTWFKDEVKLVTNKRIDVIEDNDSATLTINQATVTDSGIYKISARNILGEASCKSKLDVEEIVCKPSFKKELNNTKKNEGDSVVLLVEVEGKPKPRLRWSRNGVELEGSNNRTVSTTSNIGSLKIDNIKSKDEGLYECVAQNKSGVAKTSCRLDVTEALVAPSFSKKPNPEIQLLERETFCIEFECTGNPVPGIEITKDGKKALKGITCNYNKETGLGKVKIPGVTKLDEGLYKVTAKNSQGSLSFSVAMEVKDALELLFTKKLTDVEVMPGKNASLDVIFKGHVVDVDWYKDNEYIDDSDKYEIVDEENRCTCIIKNCNSSDAGVYRCEILNEKRKQSCAAKLYVTKSIMSLLPPGRKKIADEDTLSTGSTSTIESQQEFDVKRPSGLPVFTKPIPGKLEVIQGKDMMISISATGKPRPKLTFYKDGDEIRPDKRVTILPFGKDTTTMKIKESTLDDEGEYSIKAENFAGTAWCKGLLYVQMEAVPPKFTLKPIDIVVIEGEAMQFQVKVTGAPTPEVKIFHEEKLIGNADYECDFYTFGLEECELKHAGNYRFEATNSAGQTFTNAMLQVQQIAKEACFEKVLDDITVVEGDDIVLNVTVNGNPPPNVSFFNGDKKLNDGKNCKIFVEDNQFFLKILKSKLSDAGEYSCEIRNDAGQARCACLVKVNLPPSPPKFIRKVQNYEILEGDILCLEVEVGGYPTPDLTWQKDGTSLTNLQTEMDGVEGRIIKPLCEISDKGVYSVTATNTSGQVSCSGIIKILPAEKSPYFETELSDQSLVENDKLILTVVCKGHPVPEVEWFKDEIPLRDIDGYIFDNDKKSGKFSVICKSAKVESTGLYTALAVNSIGDEESECNVVVTEKPEKPKFVEKYSSQTIDEGRSVTFSAIVSGKPTPQVKWYKEEVLIGEEYSSFEEIERGYQCILQLDDLNQEDNGQYICIVTNTSGEISHSAKLTVQELIQPPLVEIELADTSVTEGEEVHLTAMCSGSQPLSVKWMKNNRPVHNTSTTRLEKVDNKFTLRIPKPVLNDAGAYSLEVSNYAGKCLTSCKLLIEEAPISPTFVQKLRDVKVQEGKELDITVKATGKPEPEMKWYLNDQVITESDDFTFYNGKDGKAMLKLKSSSLVHNGVLKCVAENIAGSVTSNCQLKVTELNFPPDFTQHLEDIEVYEGEDIIFKATVIGKPQPEVEWSKSRNKIEEGDGIKIVQEGNDYLLIVTEARFDDGGKYKITAVNKAGEKSSQAIVKVLKNIEAPVFITVLENIHLNTGEELVLFAEVVGSPVPKVQWQKDGQYIKEQEGVEITYTNNEIHQLTVKDLQVDDSGIYACIAHNDGGEVVTQSEVKVTEKKFKPVFTSPLKDCSFNEGADIVLSVSVKSNPPAEVNFYKDKKILKNYIDGIQINSVGNNFTVTIEESELDDAGVFECKAQNECGETITECFVRIHENQIKPVIVPIEGKDKISSVCGGNAILEVEVDGSQPLLVEWARGELLIDPTDKYEIIDEAGYCSLIIHDLHSADVGEYVCIASNEQGEVEHSFYVDIDLSTKVDISKKTEDNIATPVLDNLVESLPSMDMDDAIDGDENVTSKSILEGTIPTFSMKPKSKDVLKGSSVRFTCNSSGSPDPVLDWFFEGKLLQMSEKYQVKNTFGLSTLIVQNVTVDDVGEYQVIARNDVGESKVSFSLTIQGQKTPKIIEKPEKLLQKENVTTKVLKVAPSSPPKPSKEKTSKVAPKSKKKNPVDIAKSEKVVKVMEDDTKNKTSIETFKKSEVKTELIEKKQKVQMDKVVEKESTVEVISNEEATPDLQLVKNDDKEKDNTNSKKKTPVPPPVKEKRKKSMGSTSQPNKSDLPSEAVNVEIEFKGEPSVESTKFIDKSLSKSTSKASVEVSLLVDTRAHVKPKVIHPLRDITVVEGENIRLSAEFDGHPEMEFSWFKDEIALIESPRVLPCKEKEGMVAILEIKNAKIDDEAEYVCIASNEIGGCETAAEVLVDEKILDPIQDELNKLEEKEQKKVKSPPPVKSKPSKAGKPKQSQTREDAMDGIEENEKGISTETQVKETPLTKKDNDDVSDSKKKIEKIIKPEKTPPQPLTKKPKPTPPKPSTKPLKTTTEPSDTIKTPPKTFKKPSITNEPLFVSTNQDEMQSEVTLPDVVNVDQRLSFTKSLSNIAFVVDESLELEVITNRVEKSLQCVWYLDGDEIEEENGISFVNEPPSYKLKIDAMLEEDEGEYCCVLTDQSDEELRATCVVTHQEQFIKPKFLLPPEACETDLGDIGEFRTVITGLPKPTTTWYFNDVKLGPSEKYEIGEIGNERFLIVNNCRLDDSGEYTIEIQNKEGLEKSSAILDIVGDEEDLPLLVIPKGFQNEIHLGVGEGDLYLEVDCDSESAANITWLKDSTILKADERIKQSFDGISATLRIEEPTTDDAGIYICEAKNKAGKKQISFTIQVTGQCFLLDLYTYFDS